MAAPAEARAQSGVRAWEGYYIGGALGADFARASPFNTHLVPFGAVSAFRIASSGAHFSGRAGGSPSMEVSLLAGRNIAVTDSVLFGLEVEAGYGRTGLGEAASGAFNDFYGTLRASTTFAANDIARAQVRLDWRAAARARIGYLATPDLLLFAGAGPALAQASLSASHSGVVTVVATSLFPPSVSTTTSSEFGSAATRRVLPGFGGIIGAELRIASAFRLRWDYSLVKYTRVGATISGGVALSPPTEISVRPVAHAMRVGLVAGF